MFPCKPRYECYWYCFVLKWLLYIIYMVVDICWFMNLTISSHLATYFHVFLTFHVFKFDMNLLQNGWHQRTYTLLFQNNVLVIAKLLSFVFIVMKGLLSCYNMKFSRFSNWMSCNVTIRVYCNLWYGYI
jgi:hypothetical protein